MAKYIIDSFNGGFADVESYGINGSFKKGQNLNIRKQRNTLSCNQALVDLTPPSQGFNTLIDWFVPSSDGNIYGFSRNGRIYKIDPDLNVTLVYTDTNGQILGAAEWGISTGKKYLFWATPTRLNRKELPGNSGWTDVNADAGWPKVNLTAPLTGFNHMMKGIGGGVGALAVCNDETLALLGYDDSYTTEILRFTPGNAAKTLLQRGNNLVMGTVAKNQLVDSALFLWDGTDTEEVFGWDDMKPIPLQDIKGMIDTEVPLLVDGKGQVFYSDFSSAQPLFTFPGNGTVSPGGVTNQEYMALFAVWGNELSGIYSYGRKWKNASLVPNLEYAITCTELGALVRFGDDLLVSYNNNGVYGIKHIDPNNKAIAVYECLDLQKPASYTFQKAPIWNQIAVYTERLPLGCSISCRYILDHETTPRVANLLGGGTSFTTENGREAVFLVGDRGEIASLELTLTPSGNLTPEVDKIEWYFD